MYNGILIRYGEIFLKTSFIRKCFEKILIDNIARGLREKGITAKVRSVSGRIIVDTEQADSAYDLLEHTFGVVSFSPVVICEKKYNKIKLTSRNIAKRFPGNTTFAVDAKRSDKSFLLNSQKIKQKIGAEICRLGLRVDLSKPKNRIYIEIRDRCYVYDKIIHGSGGMPLGTAGRIAALLGNKRDLLSSWMMMKRGAEVVLVGKYDKKLHKILERWCVGRKLRAAKNIREAEKYGAMALVSSKKLKGGIVVFNPLIGYTRKETKKLYSAITR